MELAGLGLLGFGFDMGIHNIRFTVLGLQF